MEPTAARPAEVEPTKARRARMRFSVPGVAVLAAGLVITAVVTLAAFAVHERGENRLLRQRVLAATSLITSAIPSVQAPLAAAAGIAEETDAHPDTFERIVANHVGEDGQFASASIWTIEGAGPIVSVGRAPGIERRGPEEIRSFFASADDQDDMVVLGLLEDEDPRLGYAMTSPHGEGRYVVYAEAGLPPDRTSVPQEGSAFADLDYAIYLGPQEGSESLVLASTPDLPLSGRRAEAPVEFGDTVLLMVMSSDGVLAGDWNARSWWIVLVVGLVLTAGAAALTERLVRSRAEARRLSAQNARLFVEQRSIASKLQHSLLPDVPPEIQGYTMAVRYESGLEALEIGGDWYDVITVDGGPVVFAVGDVSGRGLEAATLMASLRFAMRAYAAEGDGPATILAKVNRLLNVGREGHFATILCGALDTSDGILELANAGHPQPLLLEGSSAEYVPMRTGPPIGVVADARYEAVRVSPARGATLICFTDGLVERRGRTLDEGLVRLREAARGGDERLGQLLGRIERELAPEGAHDDIAMLGVRWPT